MILAKAAVSTTGTTSVIGDLGLSPSAGSFFTGFSEAMDPSNEFSTSGMVTGRMYAADYAGVSHLFYGPWAFFDGIGPCRDHPRYLTAW